MLDEIETTVWNFNNFHLQKHAKFLNIALLCVKENSEFSDIIQVICKILMYKWIEQNTKYSPIHKIWEEV